MTQQQMIQQQMSQKQKGGDMKVNPMPDMVAHRTKAHPMSASKTSMQPSEMGAMMAKHTKTK